MNISPESVFLVGFGVLLAIAIACVVAMIALHVFLARKGR